MPIALFDDTIAHTRALPAIDVEAVAKPPVGYRPTPADQRVKQLRFIPTELRAEAQVAFREVAAMNQTKLDTALGKDAPKTSEFGDQAAAIEQNARALAAAKALVGYLTERGQILESDALKRLDRLSDDIEHFSKRDPSLRTDFALTLAYYEANGRTISQGIARAKEKKSKPE